MNIIDIPDQYFWVLDKARHQATLDTLGIITNLRREETVEKRESLKTSLQPVVGFRQAEKLWQIELGNVEEAVEDVERQQRELVDYHTTQFRRAAEDAARKYPRGFGEKQVRKDVVYYTLSRSGARFIVEAAGVNKDWNQIAEDISSGKKLGDYIPDHLVGIITELLPYALLFSSDREKLRARLGSYLKATDIDELERKMPPTIDLNQLNIGEIDTTELRDLLQTYLRSKDEFSDAFDSMATRLGLGDQKKIRLKKTIEKVVRGSKFKLAHGINELRQGRLYKKVISTVYTSQPGIYPIGADFSSLGLRENNVGHVHTRFARYRCAIKNFMNGSDSLESPVMRYVDMDRASSWHPNRGHNNILDPVLSIDDETLGLYIGYLLFGQSHPKKDTHLCYNTKKGLGSDELTDLFEKIGKLSDPPATVPASMRLDQLASVYGFSNTSSDNVYTMIPNQYTDLVGHGLLQYEDDPSPEVAKAALYAWMNDMSSKGEVWSVKMKLQYVDAIRNMAQHVGLSMTTGSVESKNRRRVRVHNSEAVGYVPKQ